MIQAEIEKYWPDSYVNSHLRTNLMDSIVVKFTQEKREDWPNGIYMNGKYMNVHINCTDQNGRDLEREPTNPEFFTLELVSAQYTYKGNYLRKCKKVSAEKIVQHVGKYFKALREKADQQK